MNDELPGRRSLADPGAEAATLGAMLLSPAVADQVSDILTAADFYNPAHEKVFQAITRALMLGHPTDSTSVASALLEAGELTKVGGAPFLLELERSVAVAANGPWHARQVADLAALRRIERANIRINQLVHQAGTTALEVAEAAQLAIHQATVERDQADLLAVDDFIDDEFQHLEDVRDGKVESGISSGFRDLDDLLGGWMPGRFIIPAGRPGMGKSISTLNWARKAAQLGHPALIFPMEMTKQEVMWRLWSDWARINLSKFQKATFAPDEWDRLRLARDEIRKLPLQIDDRATTVAQILSNSRRFAQQHGRPGVIVVDYIQRLTFPGKDRHDIEIGNAVKALKSLARELHTTVFGVCQLNRNLEARGDKRPQMSDLKDSSALEQEADAVILIHREDYYDKESPKAGEAEFIVAKHRHGPTDTVTLAAQLHFSRFKDWVSA